MADVQLATLKDIEMSGRSAVAPVRVAEGQSNSAWFAKDGSTVSFPWKQALVLEGRCFHVQVGALVTAIACGSGTVPELAEPELVISVPSGSVMMPLSVYANTIPADGFANHDDLNIILGIDRTQVHDLSGTSTTEVIYNLRTDAPRSNTCTAVSAVTADMTAAAIAMELMRTDVFMEQTTAVGTVPIIMELRYEPVAAPIIVGPAMVVLMWGGTSAVTGYAQATWAEWTKAELGIV